MLAPTTRDFHDAMERSAQFSEHTSTLFDAILAVMAERLSLPVWTFDHHFDILRGDVWR